MSATVTVHAGIMAEMDVTPRWWAMCPAYFRDAVDVLLAMDGAGVPLVLADVQIGASGIRVICHVPVEVPTDAVAATRQAVQAVLDDLDKHHVRRQAQARANEALRSKASASDAKPETPAELPPQTPAAPETPTTPEP